MRKKLASRRGETLVETLVSILIIGLVSAGLVTMIGASVNMGRTADASDKQLYSALNRAEAQLTDEAVEGERITLVVGNTQKKLDVMYYGNEAVYAYREKVSP